MMIPFSLPLLFLFPLLANAYTWQFTSPPRQCQNLSLAIQGSGQPPYSLLIIPTGPPPFPNNTEVRLIKNLPFSGKTLSFYLDYPENSSFVAVVSDKSGFGSGGASTPVTVLQSPDSSCYDPSHKVTVAWFFYAEPSGGITQCQATRLWWGPETVIGTVSFYGVVPGGTPFPIPQAPLSTTSNTGTGFNWTVDITGGTNVLLIGNDERGIGSGGSVLFTVAYWVNNSCLDSNSPSSTAGSPAGGSYPTSPSVPSTDNGNHSGNTGAIIGGVVGALVLIALVASCFLRQRLYFALSKERPVNVLHDDEDGVGAHHDLPHYYAAEPFIMPSPTTRETSEATSSQERTPLMNTADTQRPRTPLTAATMSTRKSAGSFQLVNIIQHDDAGPNDGDGESQTIELPPAYTNIRQTRRSPLSASTPTAAEDDS